MALGHEEDWDDPEDGGAADPTPASLCCRDFNRAYADSGLAPKVTLVVREVSSDTVEVFQVTTQPGSRGDGLASLALSMLAEAADRHRAWLEAEPAANMDGNGLPTEALRGWYARLGFEGDGRVMARRPRAPEPSAAPGWR